MTKNKFIYTIVSLLLLTTLISAASAKTIVAGKIYDGANFETAGTVADANIDVTCNGNLLETTSLADGTYSVAYETTACPDASLVTVVAEKDGDTNSGTGLVHDYRAVMPEMYLGIVNVPLLPEFGAVIGILTCVSAIGVFFVVRRK
jgi:hypothetical protein